MIQIEGLCARVGAFELRDISFAIPEGGYGVVIGAAGSGKTTLLETIAGIVPASAGTIRLSGADVCGLPPERRRIGFVYQHGFLFPHLTVERNIAYGAADPTSARRAADRLGAESLLQRPVRGLSGGERQLVAIARALATEPRILLLDEPFSALDPRRRVLVRREVRALHRELGITVLQVTHDFTEAGLLGDVAVLLDGGCVLQSGAPEQVFRTPASPYIAEFLGAENVFAGEVRTLAEQLPDWLDGDPAALAHGRRAIEFRTAELVLYTVGDAPDGRSHAVIRADEIILSHEPPASSARNQFRGPITEVVTLGALARVTVDVTGTPLVAALTTRSAHEMGLRPGVEVWTTFKAMAVHLC